MNLATPLDLEGPHALFVGEGASLFEAFRNGRDDATLRELQAQLVERSRALAESERRYRLLFESNPLPMWVYDVETLRFLDVNHMACHRYGFTREQFLAMTLRDIRPGDDIARLEESVRTTLPEDIGTSLWRHRRRDGTIIDVEIVSHPLEFNGRPARFVCASDVTERLKAEKALREKEQHFRALVEQSITGIYIFDEGRIVYSNPKLTEVLGYSAEELRALPLFSLVIEEDRPIARDIRRRREMGERESIVFDCRLRHKSGHVIHASVESKTIHLGGRDVSVGVVRDISIRMRALAALSESELRFRQLAENIKEVFLLMDPTNHRILYVSPAFQDIWGLSCESLYADVTVWENSIHPEDRGPALRVVNGRAATDPYDVEYRIVRPDGAIRWIRSRGFPIRNDAGVIYRIAGVSEDITERKHAERELHGLAENLERRVAERTAELESANQELESFDYSISHDLRAPLRQITGFSRMLLELCADRLDPADRQLLQRLNGASLRMDRMVNDLLALSTLTQGELLREDVDLSVLAESVFDDLRKAHPDRRVEAAVAPAIRVNADRGLLHIVLENLLGNAWKFTSQQERARIEVGQLVQGSQTVVFVRDDGAGFDMDYADKLFAPFRRLHTEAEFKGTGIGLATVQRIIRRHGGRVWAESKIGAGATFYFTLPS